MTTGRLTTLAVFLIAGCSTTQMFDAIPSSLDKSAVRMQTIEMTAEHFHFTPEEVHLKEGTLVALKIKSIDGTHGFTLGAFGIDRELKENEPNLIEFYAAKKGEYKFRCSHFCGIGHLGMSGKFIVE